MEQALKAMDQAAAGAEALVAVEWVGEEDEDEVGSVDFGVNPKSAKKRKQIF